MDKTEEKISEPISMTKVVVTIGPASSDEDTLRELIRAGMSVARLNFSHGDHDSHRQVLRRLRRIALEEGVPLAMLQDLSGPKIRLTERSEPLELKTGDTTTLAVDPEVEADLHTDFSGFLEVVSPGDTVLVDDGYIELQVKRVTANKVTFDVRDGGIVRSRKGINLPDLSVSIPVFTEKDRGDLRFGLEEKVDLVAMSYVASAADVEPIRDMMARVGWSAGVIAKIERPAALENIDQIVEAFDGIMIARGDLGVEVPPEQVPMIQKRLIRLANQRNRLVITATQMLESMIQNPRPTRAEASDVSNAILDGSDAVMLSGETAVGKWPVKAVRMMRRIAATTEASGMYSRWKAALETSADQPTEAIVQSAARVARGLNARCILVFSFSGATARLLSRYRPHCPIVAFTPQESVVRQLAACWGVMPLHLDFTPHTDEMILRGEELMKVKRLVSRGDRVVTVAGVTPMKGATNMLRIGEIS